jgi:hypothetical protein
MGMLRRAGRNRAGRGRRAAAGFDRALQAGLVQQGARHRIGPGAVLRRQGPGQLARQQVGQADALLGNVLAGLLVEHGGEHLGLLVVEQTILRRGVAHALHHHVDEHGFELGGSRLQRFGRSGTGRLAQLGHALGVDGKVAAEVGGRGAWDHGGLLK